MRILVYSPYPLDNASTPVLLDEAFEYLQNPSNEVFFITCAGEMKPCDSNYESSAIRCLECKTTSRLLKSKYKHNNLTYNKTSEFIRESDYEKIRHQIFYYKDLNEIKNIHFDEVNIGLGVVSSYVSMTRNLFPKLNRANRNFLNSSLRAAAKLTLVTKNMLNQIKPDIVLLFNGRYGGLRPVLETCKKNEIPVTILECTFSSNRRLQKKVRFDNYLPHDIDNNTATIVKTWDQKKDIETATTFFVKRRASEVASDSVYTKNQNPDLLPQEWDSSKRNFIIFNSSEDEFFCVGDSFDKYKIFNNQIEGITYLIERAEKDLSIHFYLRIHPNLKNLNYKYVSKLSVIFKNNKNITVIDADSPISTYKLIDNCEKVFVFGSTAGVEASYWGKPVVLLAGSFYIHLNVAYYPKNFEELDKLIFEQIIPMPKLGSLKYALFVFGERGETYKHVNFNFRFLNAFGKTLYIPESYTVLGSHLLYYSLVGFFRILNSISHIHFKLIKTKKMYIELPNYL